MAKHTTRTTAIRVAAPALPDLDYTAAYVDARGVNPTLIIGQRAHTIEGVERNITVNDAISIAHMRGMLE